jgi:hypothetical protein
VAARLEADYESIAFDACSCSGGWDCRLLGNGIRIRGSATEPGLAAGSRLHSHPAIGPHRQPSTSSVFSGEPRHVYVQIVGALLLLLSVANLFFSRYFGWKKELAPLSLLTRQVFQVHCFFIALVLMLLGACSLFYTDTLLEPSP